MENLRGVSKKNSFVQCYKSDQDSVDHAIRDSIEGRTVKLEPSR